MGEQFCQRKHSLVEPEICQMEPLLPTPIHWGSFDIWFSGRGTGELVFHQGTWSECGSRVLKLFFIPISYLYRHFSNTLTEWRRWNFVLVPKQTFYPNYLTFRAATISTRPEICVKVRVPSKYVLFGKLFCRARFYLAELICQSASPNFLGDSFNFLHKHLVVRNFVFAKNNIPKTDYLF